MYISKAIADTDRDLKPTHHHAYSGSLGNSRANSNTDAHATGPHGDTRTNSAPHHTSRSNHNARTNLPPANSDLGGIPHPYR